MASRRPPRLRRLADPHPRRRHHRRRWTVLDRAAEAPPAWLRAAAVDYLAKARARRRRLARADRRSRDARAPLATLPLIAVRLPKFTDGRGYSIAYLLRRADGYRGELRAIGDVLRRPALICGGCGFDAFAVRADQDARRRWLRSPLFSDAYQGTWDAALPAFRRRPRLAAAG